MAHSDAFLDALRGFADAVRRKNAPRVAAGAEEQLRGPFENLLAAAAAEFGVDATCAGEAALPSRLGRPDFAVSSAGALAGYVELKAPGTGADQRRFRGRNRAQFKRFSAIPNILYGDGNEWALYRNGERSGRLVRLSGDIVMGGAGAVREQDAARLAQLLRDFLSWQPILPQDARGRIDLKAFAALLAPLCRLLRDDVTEALGRDASTLSTLAQDWRQLLFPDATDAQFADAYAQTVAFALLLGRAEGAEPLTLANAQDTLAAHHNLLSRALQVLTDPNVRGEMSASLALLQRVLAVVPPALFDTAHDPWLYFYEDFLAAYDPKLRKDAGVYYTPIEVVRTQVRLVDDLLTNRLGRPLGFADPEVTTLDPAVGTGTYLLGIVEHALARVAERYGTGAVAGHATTLAGNLHGFERLVGAYAVSELRVSRLLQQRGATSHRANIYLTDTLESPHAEPRQLPLFMQPISEQHRLALAVKRQTPMVVCLGNPPYDRHEAARADNGHRTGAWVRWGEDGDDQPIFRDFAAPVEAAGRGGQLKNLYNLYVYFWRWALWKVFEQDDQRGGVVSFITAASYLDGDAFLGMREHLRRVCDEIWILDIGGEGRGSRQSDNVFAIQTPVAIAIAMRRGAVQAAVPANVYYALIDGRRAQKLKRLDAIKDFEDVRWQDCPNLWPAPFLPAGASGYFNLPRLADLMPWQHSGVQLKRTWPIAPDAATLIQRWRTLMRAKERAKLFRETSDRQVAGRYRVALIETTAAPDESPLAELPADAETPPIHRYAYRTLDRQHILADGRLISRPRPDLWRIQGERQVYLTSLLTQPLGRGPALFACADVPDLHHFSGRGAKDVIPLYRSADGGEANIAPGLLNQLPLANASAEDFLAYLYGALAHPTFTERFAHELGSRELRVPITTDAALFLEVRAIGRELLKLHTYHQRFLGGDESTAVPSGNARCTEGVPVTEDGYPESFVHDAATQELRVGEGVFAPVPAKIYEFEVSGLKVVQSWLRYRMKRGAGRQSSPLNELRPAIWPATYTQELLELIWVLEGTLALYPEQARLLDRVLEGPCLQADSIPPAPALLRRPPPVPNRAPSLDDEPLRYM